MPPRLIIDFLEDGADALRSVRQANWSVECLVTSRSALPTSEGRKALDVPGVYLLIGPPAKADDNLHRDSRLYVGQADSVADRLDTHLKTSSMKWWRTVVVVRQRDDKDPLNLGQCKFLESRLYELATKASTCVLTNKNAPHRPAIGQAEQGIANDFLANAIVIVSALGFNFFEPRSTSTVPQENDGPPQVPGNLQELLEELRKAATGPSFPKAQWYWTRTPDYRTKVVNGGDFRVFLRVRWNKNCLRVGLHSRGEREKFTVSNSAELEKRHEEIQKAYNKAIKYLQRDK